jgi:hypothetical protein
MQDDELADDDLNSLLNAMARALLTWQKVEMNLFLIFNFLSANKNPAISSAIYYAQVHISPQIKIVNAVAKVVLNGNPYLEKWNDINEEINRKLKYRNKLAHFGLEEYSSKGKTRLLLKPSIFKSSPDHEQYYGIESIEEWSFAFISLADEMSKFLDDLPEALRS